MGSRGAAGHTLGARVFGSIPSYTTFKRFVTQTAASSYHEVFNFDQTKWDAMTDSEKEGVYQYTSFWYSDINTALRERQTPNSRIQAYIDGATEALKKWHAAEDVMVFRGANHHWTANLLGGTESQLDNPAFLRSRIGKTVTDRGFMSSGTHEYSAWGGVQYKIYVRKGVEGMYVDPISANSGEKEFLFNRDTRFVVHQIKTDSRGKVSELVLEAIDTKH